MLRAVRLPHKSPPHPGHEMEGVASAQQQGEGAVQKERDAAVRPGEKYNRGDQIEQQIADVKNRFAEFSRRSLMNRFHLHSPLPPTQP